MDRFAKEQGARVPGLAPEDGCMWDAIVDRQQGFLNFTPRLLAALRESRVAVLGAGGNGVVADHLVRLGFERFILVDPDVVEASNLNRPPWACPRWRPGGGICWP
jgi:hypothetical protein